MSQELSLEQQIQILTQLQSSFSHTSTLFEKLEVLNQLPIVQEYLKEPNPIQAFLTGLNLECEYVIKSIIAIGQAAIVFNIQPSPESFESLKELLEQLLIVEHFYQYMGGIIGYHLTVLTMIVNKQAKTPIKTPTHYIHPEGLYLNHNTPEIRQAIRWGIENTPHIAEIYPVGGAGDRLNLVDNLNGTPLPAAKLSFAGKTLLEGLIRDVQAREYLYFKFYNKQLTTPIAMMTSAEKNNHMHILTICREQHWFGRPSQSFFFFIQPLVPVITIEGNWALSAPLKLILKPGGHGVIWKLAHDQGVFSWLSSQERQQVLVRQINNPVAGTDSAILALIGLGCAQNKSFGFISCERLVNSAEGMNVLVETETPQGYGYCLTNIEYTDFANKGIQESSPQTDSLYSIYPTNTNILFASIPAIEEALKCCPIPGQLINMKTKMTYMDPKGNLSDKEGGRLESTMQNIADCFVDIFPEKLSPDKHRESLRTFIVYNPRKKTISTTKRSYKPSESPVDTPEQAYYDILSNHFQLLTDYCQFDVPPMDTLDHYLKQPPPFIMLYHPALGPIYSIIAQKLRKGRIAPHAYLHLEIAELDIYDLDLEGSLWIEASCPLGHQETSDLIYYGRESRCHLHHVKVRNKGLQPLSTQDVWKHTFSHQESLHILLHAEAEFYAEHILFEGSHFYEVPAHHSLTITLNNEGKLIEELRPITQASWYWHYTFNPDHTIQLQKI